MEVAVARWRRLTNAELARKGWAWEMRVCGGEVYVRRLYGQAQNEPSLSRRVTPRSRG